MYIPFFNVFKKITHRVHLSVVLWIVFTLIVAFEIGLLYHTMYLGSKTQDTQISDTSVSQSLEVNFSIYEDTVEWLNVHESFELPQYSLTGNGQGRENPFLEY